MISWQFRKNKKTKQVNLVKAGWLIKSNYTPINSLIKNLDILFSKYKRLSNLTSQGYIRCFTCGAFLTFRMADCGHYVGRECMATRYLDENTACQCHSCNRFAEGKKDVFAINLVKKYGVDILDRLNKLKHSTKQFTADELQEMIVYYKTKVKELEIK